MRWRFLHAADLHLDSPLKNLEAKSEALAGLLHLATRQAFVKLVDACLEEEAALLLIAGDLYDHDSPNMQVAVFLREQLRRLDERGVRVVIVKGNHDADNKITSYLPLPGNTTVLSDRAPQTIVMDAPARIAIHGQSFPPGKVTDNLAARYPAPLAGHFNIGLLHTSLEGNSIHAEYAPCSRSDLSSRGYGYWALGHIHKSEIVAREPEPWIVYPGNLQGRSPRETGPKGCFVVEVEDDRVVSAQHRALDVIRWQSVDVELAGAGDEAALIEALREKIALAWEACEGRPGALRVTLRGESALHGELAARPRRLQQTVLELLGEVGRGDLWLEALKVETSPLPAQREADAASGGAVEALLAIVREIAADPDAMRPLMEQALGPLRARLPDELKRHEALLGLDDLEAARLLATRLEPLMAARLTGGADD